ncbi:MAG: Ig-like domain-containing protein [Mariprofundaceae bacterium]
MRKFIIAAAVILTGLGLNACDVDSGQANSTTAPLVASFDPGESVIPFPTNILFSGSVDGTLNIPLDPGVLPTDFSEPKVALNALNGFSTIAPISTTFSTSVDNATVFPGGASVRVFEVTADPFTTAVTGVVGELTAGLDYVATINPADPTQTTLAIQPLKPLTPSTHYMVVVTNGVKAVSGEAAMADLAFQFLKLTTPLVDGGGVSQIPASDADAAALEPLRQLTQAMLGHAQVFAGIAPADVALVWTFKTQSINQVLPTIRVDVRANAAPVMTPLPAQDIATFALANGLDPLLFPDVGSVVVGSVALPYYLTASTGPQDPAALTGFFDIPPGSSLPNLQSPENVPFLLITPNSPVPLNAGWPVVIFQHGFQVDKTVVFGIANTLASQGLAVIAIDAVLHGDRTFGLDFATEDCPVSPFDCTVTANVPDGVDDSSGLYYLNLTNLLTFRDNARQSVADLFGLTWALENQALDVVDNATGLPGGDGFSDFSQTGLSFVGHSNGGILGTMYLANEPAVFTGVLANPGGVYSEIAKNSTEISPLVDAGLAAQGVFPGSAEYAAFFVAAQTVLDDGDPINYGGILAALGNNILLLKTTPDGVVPNAQTDALSLVMGLQQVSVDPGVLWPLGRQATGFVGSGFTNLTVGGHSTFLSPTANPPSLPGYLEMQSQMATYLTNNSIDITDTTVVE